MIFSKYQKYKNTPHFLEDDFVHYRKEATQTYLSEKVLAIPILNHELTVINHFFYKAEFNYNCCSQT